MTHTTHFLHCFQCFRTNARRLFQRIDTVGRFLDLERFFAQSCGRLETRHVQQEWLQIAQIEWERDRLGGGGHGL